MELLSWGFKNYAERAISVTDKLITETPWWTNTWRIYSSQEKSLALEIGFLGEPFSPPQWQQAFSWETKATLLTKRKRAPAMSSCSSSNCIVCTHPLCRVIPGGDFIYAMA